MKQIDLEGGKQILNGFTYMWIIRGKKADELAEKNKLPHGRDYLFSLRNSTGESYFLGCTSNIKTVRK